MTHYQNMARINNIIFFYNVAKERGLGYLIGGLSQEDKNRLIDKVSKLLRRDEFKIIAEVERVTE